VQEPVERKIGTPMSEKEAEQYFRLHEMLFEFARLFEYGETSDRAVAIVGPAFLDTLLTEILINFLVDDQKEVQKLIQPEVSSRHVRRQDIGVLLSRPNWRDNQI